MSPIKDFPPDFQPSLQARQEIIVSGKELLDMSDFAWRIGAVAIVGLIYHSLVNPPWMWFALGNNVTLRDLIDFRRMQEMIPTGTLTAVDEEFKQGHRFAEFYGFRRTGEVKFHKDRTYLVYRRD